jgi:hypothetical protein
VASRQQITRLEHRIDALVAHLEPPAHAQFELWRVEGNKAWQLKDPQHVITRAELKARPAPRIVIGFVRPSNGRPAGVARA